MMKLFQKTISLFCALGLLSSLSVPAFAAEPVTLDPDYHPEVWLGSIPEEGKDTSFQMPYNPGTGTTGLSVFSFVADSDTLMFQINWNQAQVADTYHYVLWQKDENGNLDSVVGTFYKCSFGVWQLYPDLTAGKSYELIVSSTCVPPTGASCTYIYTN